MKIVKVLNHSDEVSGTFLMEDGSKAFWTEGRSSETVIHHPDGRVEMIPAAEAAEYDFGENGPDEDCEIRCMTPAEESEWETARAGKRQH